MVKFEPHNSLRTPDSTSPPKQNKQAQTGPKKSKYAARAGAPVMDQFLQRSSARAYTTRRQYSDTPKSTILRTKLASTVYELQSSYRKMKARQLTVLDSFFTTNMRRMQRVNNRFAAIVATDSATFAGQQVSSEILRRSVYQNHRLLRAKVPVSRMPARTQSAFLTKAAQVCMMSGRFLHSHWAKIGAASFLLGSAHFTYKYGRSQMHSASFGGMTATEKLMNVKDNLRQRFNDECYWRWIDLWAYGPVMSVWGNWWSRIFQKPSMHETLIDLLNDGIHRPSFVAESALFGQRWIEHCVTQQKTIDEAVKLSYRTFCETQQVSKAAADICIYVVQQEKAVNASADICMRSFLSDRTFDIFLWQVACSFCNVVMNEEFNTNTSQWMVQHPFNASTIEEIKTEMLVTTQDQLSAPLRPSTYLDMFRSEAA